MFYGTYHGVLTLYVLPVAPRKLTFILTIGVILIVLNKKTSLFLMEVRSNIKT